MELTLKKRITGIREHWAVQEVHKKEVRTDCGCTAGAMRTYIDRRTRY